MKVIREVKWIFGALIAISIGIQQGCVSLSSDREKEIPKITQDTPLPEAINIAVTYGGESLEIVKKRIKAENAWDQVEKQTKEIVLKDATTRPQDQIINAIHLYQISAKDISPDIVLALFHAEQPAVKQIGWQISALRPSREIRDLMEKELTRVIYEGEESSVLVPEMARAVMANRLSGVYSLLREGLMTTGDADFVRAMIQFYPRQASQDFMNYLAQASIEDLRQLRQKMVNAHSCFIILNHFLRYPPAVTHPRYSHLFLFAVSRNQALRELTNRVLERQYPQNKEQMAMTLAGLPVWIQLAFVEGVRERLTPNIGVFLNQLQQVTAHKEVLEEISALKY